MKIVVEQLNDLMLKLNCIEARLTGVELHEEDAECVKEAELLLAKYNVEVLKLENIIVQKKLLLSKLGKL